MLSPSVKKILKDKELKTIFIMGFTIIVFSTIHLILLYSQWLEFNSNMEDKADIKTMVDDGFLEFKEEILNDYRIACLSREASTLGRREVLTGKAKFGIFGGGKELPQIAMAKFFKKGDFRSGYYRDQTFMMAIGELTIEQLFAALYAHPDINYDPHSAGRQMVSHFATPTINDDGTWKNLTDSYNSSADISPTGGQMGRLLGLAQASSVFRKNKALQNFTEFSNNGNEIAFGSIGDASTSEGVFFEAINAACVMQVPMIVSVWDDNYGISVHKKFQTAKESISECLKGFESSNGTNGCKIYTVNGWDYKALINTYKIASNHCREKHEPVLIHVTELTQPQGHSTSGSHERYKSKERLDWEQEYDCINQFKTWILQEEIAGRKIAVEKDLEEIENACKKEVRAAQKKAWISFQQSIKKELSEVTHLIENLEKTSPNADKLGEIKKTLLSYNEPVRREIQESVKKALRTIRFDSSPAKADLLNWIKNSKEENRKRYSTHLYSEGPRSILKVNPVVAKYSEDSKLVDARLVLRDNFDVLFQSNPMILAFGEDVGVIGGVNQCMEGMQEKYGEHRVFDTGIREATIIGQGIGMAMRGLRPIAEIQYLDYIYYAVQIISDDLATVQYRSFGRQKAPLIIRTRGHRLEGIWHSGSPMGMLINSLRGVVIGVPSTMTKAAGMYNALLQSDDPALVIEPLNSYRKKEKLPENLGEFTTPIGVPDIVREGTDLTLVSYGSTFNLCLLAVDELKELGISVECIDVQTLLPFDINHLIVESLKKTNKLLIVDEDVPGGASAFILKQILEDQKGYYYLDSAPKTLTANEHRPAYGSDGDYFSKPNVEDVFEAAYSLMNDSDPVKYPDIYKG